MSHEQQGTHVGRRGGGDNLLQYYSTVIDNGTLTAVPDQEPVEIRYSGQTNV